MGPEGPKDKDGIGQPLAWPDVFVPVKGLQVRKTFRIFPSLGSLRFKLMVWERDKGPSRKRETPRRLYDERVIDRASAAAKGSILGLAAMSGKGL